ncbi:nucleoside recognition domain-containing protein [Cupriavidus taiwanensis]|uniref:Bifunctional spore maturation protein, fused SpmA/SpmB n=1 Tax=Cupriavidus taiwanensis TaxID=164546 RepID=A0A7Z7J4R9_9BURK|nr:spore maturation protein [Cupriavidus taiwanensis]SOY89921.1 Bifunctional spore maturation protein, fused SpmA/SpmB precursor [Cupriavidus taiwanensis]SOZ00455.1 Bifunctional spore maturation protein, fused SpmA/SpmB precursor [Cupriavidus taiwanensis]SOZ03561.1 Bifunctional spore maturation protein, fused SpmA/SpmB precursor [Cupriavidus taiwanensis]SPC07800.1 Bifunctional spore maturation protein, fused SpmA/SpmB precursor [Cupriavidus taiwanensis]SPD42104.1 Bifunctional spore maturation 
MALNVVWLGFFLISFSAACVRVAQGDLAVFPAMLGSLFDSARTAFEIALGLAGVMSLWLGIMRIGERAGVVDVFARLVNPLLRHFFPGVPGGHPAQGAMMMNVSANLLGLDNAATPLGLNAMRELQTLNRRPDVATDAQIMFIVLNSAGLTLIPTSVIAIRQTIAVKQGLVGFNAADIFLPTLLATGGSCLAGLLAVAWVQRINLLRPAVLVAFGLVIALLGAMFAWLQHAPPEQVGTVTALAGAGFILSLITLFLICGALRRVNVYDAFIDGAKEGFGVAVQIIPYLVAILVAIGLFRAAGCMDVLMAWLTHAIAGLGANTDFVPALPVGLMKILSGAGARGLMVDVMTTYGVDSFQGRLAAIIQGSTETTFYVLAVYFGSINVRDTRHALGCALVADAVGIICAVGAAYLFR